MTDSRRAGGERIPPASPLPSTASGHQHPRGSPGRSPLGRPRGGASAAASLATRRLLGVAPRLVGTDHLVGVTPRGSRPCSAGGAQRDEPPNLPPSLAVKVGKRAPSCTQHSHPTPAVPWVKHIFPKIIQPKPCPQQASPLSWWLIAVSCYYKIPT